MVLDKLMGGVVGVMGSNMFDRVPMYGIYTSAIMMAVTG